MGISLNPETKDSQRSQSLRINTSFNKYIVMTEIEVQNKINFRNIIIFFLIGLAGVINGFRDFDIYPDRIAKILFPDPVTYHNVVVLNNTMMNSLTVQNTMSFGAMSVMIIAVVIVLAFIMSTMAGVVGRGD